MGYKIMDREQTAYSLDGWNCPDYYERNKDKHIDKKYNSYGDVLVETDRVKSGIGIKVNVFWRNQWYWIPIFSKYGKYFHWLFFMIWVDYEYRESNPRVIADHLGEILNHQKN